MSVDAHHPDYDDRIADWELMRHCDEGERVVKNEGEVYLPMPNGFTKQSDGGVGMYNAYRLRAQFPDIPQPTLAGMVGVIHRKDAQIEGIEDKSPLSPLWEKATKDGLPLEAFHRRITSELLLMGRYSILTDVPSEAGQDAIPYFAGYTAERLINWADPERDLFVLNESRKVRGEAGQDEFVWNDETRYRVLRLKDGVYTQQEYATEKQSEGDLIEPAVRGGKRLEEIPFVVVGPRDLSFDFVQPPLIGVSRAALAIYRLDADYRFQLFTSGQETLFVIGETENLPKVIGAGVVFGLPANCDAKFVTPTCAGIAAHRQAIEDARSAAVAAGVKLFDQQKAAESGEALRLRAAAQTATLTTIAQASAAALEKSLRFAAIFMGIDPNEIVVKPNLEFVENLMNPADAQALVTVWQSGAIAKETLYENLQRGGIASQERTFEQEQELIDQEAIDMPQGAGGNTAFAGAPPQGGAPGGTAPAMNGAAAPLSDRFVETGEGLTIEQQ